MKRTALVRRTPLSSGKKGLRRTGRFRRSQARSDFRANIIRGKVTRRRTGFDRATKARILDRDQASCVIAVCCDGRPGSAQTVHHLENRGMGGTPADSPVNSVTNGVAACHLDNAWIEDHPLQARQMGWKRPRGTTAPVTYPDGRRYRLLTDGTRRPE